MLRIKSDFETDLNEVFAANRNLNGIQVQFGSAMMAEFRTYDTRADAQILAFGCNREGQVGLGNGDDIVITPTALCKDQIDSSTVLSIVISQKQSFLLTRDGSVLNCGENDNNELGRFGKRSIFRRVDSLEAYTISDIALGDGFTLLLSKDGKLISWGQNSLGQLGSGDREFRDKPKLNSAIPNDTILQIAAGLQHVVALSKSGNVLTW